jgi:undecaprenyl phosphate-alpha-L-ara4FN deformylase
MAECVALRADIDTVKDAEVLPVLLAILDEYELKATFFVTTGKDNLAKNLKNYRNPLRLIKKIPRYGLTPVLYSLILKREVQESRNLNLILENGHELGLHGYDHYTWLNYLDSFTEEQISDFIANGCERIEKVFGFYPNAFAAPGFKTNPNFIAVLDDFRFKYSSDYIGERAFYPELNGKRMKTLQVPVSMSSFGELEDEGLGDDQIFTVTADAFSRLEFLVLYLHPSYEPIFKKKLLDRVLTYLADHSKVVTMSQIADLIRGEGLV